MNLILNIGVLHLLPLDNQNKYNLSERIACGFLDSYFRIIAGIGNSVVWKPYH